MGSLASGIAGLVEGDPTKSEENQLGALAGYGTGVGEGLTTAAAGFDEAVLSGDPTRIAQALAPEISGQQQQIQQQAKTNAEFGTRSGGTAASTAAAPAAARGNIINQVGALQSGTASQAGSLGGNLLSQASGNINDEAQLAAKARQNQLSEIGGVTKGVGQTIADNPDNAFGWVPGNESPTEAPTESGGGDAWTGYSGFDNPENYG